MFSACYCYADNNANIVVLHFVTLFSIPGAASSIGAVSFLNPPGGAAHSRAEYRGRGARGTRGYTGGVQDPGQARRGEALLPEGIGGSDTWEGLHAGHTSVRWHGTGTAKHAPSVGYADSLLTIASHRRVQTIRGSQTMYSQWQSGRISSLILTTSKRRTGPVTDLAVMERTERMS